MFIIINLIWTQFELYLTKYSLLSEFINYKNDNLEQMRSQTNYMNEYFGLFICPFKKEKENN